VAVNTGRQVFCWSLNRCATDLGATCPVREALGRRVAAGKMSTEVIMGALREVFKPATWDRIRPRQAARAADCSLRFSAVYINKACGSALSIEMAAQGSQLGDNGWWWREVWESNVQRPLSDSESARGFRLETACSSTHD